jgi:maltose-binding protein MalE
MKKVIAVLSIVALASCGGGKSTEVSTTDSTVVKTDSTIVTDSTKVDSIKVVVDSTK